MPRTRHRLAVTETDAIAHALDLAAQRWPAKTRAQLLARLVEEGAQHIQDDEARRHATITATSGALTGVYGPGYLAELARGLARVTLVLDASALIAHLDGHDQQHHDAVEALLLGATGRSLAASPITPR